MPQMRTPSSWLVVFEHFFVWLFFFSAVAVMPYWRVPILRSSTHGERSEPVRSSISMNCSWRGTGAAGGSAGASGVGVVCTVGTCSFGGVSSTAAGAAMSSSMSNMPRSSATSSLFVSLSAGRLLRSSALGLSGSGVPWALDSPRRRPPFHARRSRSLGELKTSRRTCSHSFVLTVVEPVPALQRLGHAAGLLLMRAASVSSS